MSKPHLAPVAVLIELPPRGGKSLAARLQLRGNHAVYRPGETNRCPGCGRSQWEVGRTMAECGHCHAALPIAADGAAP